MQAELNLKKYQRRELRSPWPVSRLPGDVGGGWRVALLELEAIDLFVWGLGWV